MSQKSDSVVQKGTSKGYSPSCKKTPPHRKMINRLRRLRQGAVKGNCEKPMNSGRNQKDKGPFYLKFI